MTKAGILVGIVGGIVAIYVAVFPVPQYFERLNGRISQLEEQTRSLAPTAMMADHLNGRVGQLEEQMRSLTALSSPTAEANARLDGRISQLEEKMRSLSASSAATTATVSELIRKPAIAVNPLLQKCAELADESNTGERNSAMGLYAGPEVTRNALMSMEKLGCGSIAR